MKKFVMFSSYKKTLGTLALVITALIWGLAFSAQRSGALYLPANIFLAIRSYIGVLVLIPVICILDRRAGVPFSLCGKHQNEQERKFLFVGGSICGVVLFTASILQQLGLKYVTAGKCGFLTALYIVIVPFIGVFLKRKIRWNMWVSVCQVQFGTYFLCSKNKMGSLGIGDILVIVCAFCYAIHIIVVDHFAPHTDCIRLSLIQFLITAILSMFFSILLGEEWNMGSLYHAVPQLLFCGIGSTGIAFTLQIVGQKYVHPVTACLIMSLESVFSTIGGWLVLGETLTFREIFGCALIFFAVILSQIPFEKKQDSKSAVS